MHMRDDCVEAVRLAMRMSRQMNAGAEATECRIVYETDQPNAGHTVYDSGLG